MSHEITVGAGDQARADRESAPIVHITEKAVEMVKLAMEREGATGHGLRVAALGGGCSGLQYHLSFVAEPGEDDGVFEVGGIKVFVDSASQPHLQGITVDYVIGLHAAGFKFLNPNASRTCGCGASFAT